jgi:predicted phosphoribosyltransferase
MKFRNRQEAGRKVAARLGKYGNREDVIVLGIPRGGVVVAFEVATALGLPLDIFVLRKLGVPGHEELAFGAIGSGGVRILNADIVDRLGISELEIAAVAKEQTKELDQREYRYRGKRPPLEVQGRTVIVVDDGIATGASIRAAIDAIRKMRPAALVVAAPVAPRATCQLLRHEVDELVCAYTTESFYGVGQFYQDFSQVSDEEVVALLDRAVLQKRDSKEAVAPVLAEI